MIPTPTAADRFSALRTARENLDRLVLEELAQAPEDSHRRIAARAVRRLLDGSPRGYSRVAETMREAIGTIHACYRLIECPDCIDGIPTDVVTIKNPDERGPRHIDVCSHCEGEGGVLPPPPCPIHGSTGIGWEWGTTGHATPVCSGCCRDGAWRFTEAYEEATNAYHRLSRTNLYQHLGIIDSEADPY